MELNALEIALRTAALFEAAALAPRTRRAYAWQAERWAAWATRRAVSWLPAGPEHVGAYLAEWAAAGATPATLAQARAAIGHVHTRAGHADPTRAEHVARVLKGIRRKKGARPRQAPALGVPELRKLVARASVRDRALLVLGFAAALRRSELAALELADVSIDGRELTLTIQRSKTDQESMGVVLRLPAGVHEHTCPVRTLRAWLKERGTHPGPLFTSAGRRRTGMRALTGDDVAKIFARACDRARLRGYSAHSLRAGCATAASLAGVPEPLIQRHGRWASRRTLERYLRAEATGDVVRAIGL